MGGNSDSTVKEFESLGKINFASLFHLLFGFMSIDLKRKFGTGGSVILASCFESAGKEIALLYSSAWHLEKWDAEIFSKVLVDFYKRLDVNCTASVASEHEITVVISDRLIGDEMNQIQTLAYYNSMASMHLSMLFAVGLADTLRSPTSVILTKSGRVQFRLYLDRNHTK